MHSPCCVFVCLALPRNDTAMRRAAVFIFPKRGADMVYSVFVQHRDGTYLTVACCNDLEQAVQIAETLCTSYPQKYVVRDSMGNDVYVRGEASTSPSIPILVVDDYKDRRAE